MSDSLPELLERIESFRFDPPGCSLTFADRLARENGWSSGHADRVVREYLRFCVLAVRCDHPVTPSVDVDQAWHLHLTYTRSYWDHFCKTVLQQPLHHDPTTGGPSEGRKFRDWYARTLHSYYRLFHEHPPADIWPSPELRFADAAELRWINTRRFWLIRKPPHCTVWIGAMVVAALPGWDNLRNALLNWLPHGLHAGMAPALLALQAVVCFAMLLLCPIRDYWKKQSTSPQPLPSGEPTAEELAVLAGGRNRLLWLAVVRLRALGLITVDKPGLFRPARLVPCSEEPTEPPRLSPLDTAVLTGIRHQLALPALSRWAQSYHDRILRRLQYHKFVSESPITSPGILALQLCVPLLTFLASLPTLVNTACFPHSVWLTVGTIILSLMTGVQTSRITSYGRHVLLSKRIETLPEESDETQQ
ncbi:MAG TPA: hypothetical protein DCX79_12825, partial [Planctomycetaceae bacterium]|nr:hypothetical protein [Planctomycetaceae bacterium]